MSKVTVEFFNGNTSTFENARYRVRGENYVLTRNGKAFLRVGRVYVYGIELTAGGHVPNANKTGAGTAQGGEKAV